MLRAWFAGLLGAGAPRRHTARRPRYCRPRLEALEARAVPALVVNDLTTGLTPTQLAQSLAGPGVTISNVSFTGVPQAAGEFTGGTGIIGFEQGIILSSGHANGVPGPNDDTNGPNPSFDNGQPGDPQLNTLTTPSNPTFDAAVLQFDIVPQASTLTFKYVFSSEEYNDFVKAGFNDVFGLFVNGANVALIPGTNTPVGIDTVNLTTNSQFYINNAPSDDPFPATPPLLNTQMDGLTVVLTATAQVNPGVLNHIKLGIEDAGDAIFDSDVFIQAGSFSAPSPPVFQAYRPFRYAFRSLQENSLGTPPKPGTPPVPFLGPVAIDTFDGNITILDVGQTAADGPLTVTLHGLPSGVQLINATGFNPVSGDPFIVVPTGAPIGVPVRVPIKLSNPNHLPLGTFFIGPPFIEVTAANS
jgi:hypothetical protein